MAAELSREIPGSERETLYFISYLPGKLSFLATHLTFLQWLSHYYNNAYFLLSMDYMPDTVPGTSFSVSFKFNVYQFDQEDISPILQLRKTEHHSG